jgi:predicted phosphodiesterase
MRVAAIYDIHANFPALEAVLHDIHQASVDLIIVGGDVFPGPMPNEAIDLLLRLDIPVQFIHGNGDREVLAQMQGVETDWFRNAPEFWREPVRWTARQLPLPLTSRLSAWPGTLTVAIAPLGEVFFCHATPRNDMECFTRLTPEPVLAPVFAGIHAPIVVCGHTHMQFDRTVGPTRVLNAGSVGMPFGEPGAYWLLLGPGVELRRTSYDLAEAAARVRVTAYPQAQDFAERSILHPPSEAASLEAFSRVELK